MLPQNCSSFLLLHNKLPKKLVTWNSNLLLSFNLLRQQVYRWFLSIIIYGSLGWLASAGQFFLRVSHAAGAGIFWQINQDSSLTWLAADANWAGSSAGAVKQCARSSFPMWLKLLTAWWAMFQEVESQAFQEAQAEIERLLMIWAQMF